MAGTVLGDVQWDALLKELYPGDLPREIMERNHPFLSMVPKSGGAVGEYTVVPVLYDLPSGRSSNIATLLGASGPISPHKSAKFNVTLVEDYAATWLNMLTVYKTMNDRGAFVEARKREVDGLLMQLGNSLSHALYRDGGGAVGRISTGSGTATAVLTRFADTKFFTIGGLYFLVADDGSGNPNYAAPRDSSDVVEVSAINEDTGSVTFTTTISTTITGAADGDHFVPAGDTAGEKVSGLSAWIPLVSPSATLFFGVNRTAYPTRLAGNRMDQVTVPAEDTIMELAEIMAERGARPDKCFVSPRQFTKISRRLGAKVEYDGAGGQADVGFANVKIHTSAGTVSITPDPDCPDNRGYLLTMDSWRLMHLLELPHIVTDDNLRALRRPALDQIEIRCRYYAQLACYAPGHNGVFSCA